MSADEFEHCQANFVAQICQVEIEGTVLISAPFADVLHDLGDAPLVGLRKLSYPLHDEGNIFIAQLLYSYRFDNSTLN